MEKNEHIKTTALRYHEVDPRWEMFGCPDYESYLNRYLVAGRFHNLVPKPVTDAYTTIEYLMAHAYYFYPIYDEALAKLLRTMEMALKIRCKQLGIDIVNHKKSKKKTVYHDFYNLIEFVDKAEPEKHLGPNLHIARDIRNYAMHPDANSYMGGMSVPACITNVNSLNILFAPTGFFNAYINSFETYRELLAPLNEKPIVMTYKGQRILLHKFSVVDVFIDTSGVELGCIHAPTILPSLEKEGDEDFRFGRDFILHVQNMKLIDGKFICEEIGSGDLISFENSNHELDVSRYKEYKTYIQNAIFGMHNQYDIMENTHRSQAMAYFRYNYFQQLRFEEVSEPQS